MLVLSGILVVIGGFALRINPLLVVTAAALVSAMAAGHAPGEAVGMIGKAFVDNRFIAVPWLVLPTIGLLERAGLRQRASILVRQLHGATAGHVLIGYLAMRQVTAALGLTSLGGHVQMVRPIVAPMVEGAAEREAAVAPDTRDRLRAHAAAADNIGLFFGEDVFIAIGSILLIRGVMAENGIVVVPLNLALWAAPTAVAAFVVHGIRVILFERRLRAAERLQ